MSPDNVSGLVLSNALGGIFGGIFTIDELIWLVVYWDLGYLLDCY